MRRAHSGTISSMKLGELATRLGAELRGDAELEITGVKGIEEAGPTEVTFVANPRYTALARKTQAAAVLVEPEFPEIAAATLRIKNPYLGLFPRAGHVLSASRLPSRHPPHGGDRPDCGDRRRGAHRRLCGDRPRRALGAHATLLPHVVLYPGVQAGSHLFAHAHAVVREDCILGDHVTLENGAIVGADGFGFTKNEPGSGKRFRSPGRCGWATGSMCRPTPVLTGPRWARPRLATAPRWTTWCRWATVRGWAENTLVCAQTGLAGSSVVGNNVILAGQTGIAGHCTVGDGVILTAQSAVSHDVPPGKMISGSPGFDNRVWLRAVTIFQRLPELLKRLDRVEKKLAVQNATDGNKEKE